MDHEAEDVRELKLEFEVEDAKELNTVLLANDGLAVQEPVGVLVKQGLKEVLEV